MTLPVGHAERFDICNSWWLVFCEDSSDFLPTLPDGFADHVITDPPYDEQTHTRAKTGFRPKQADIDFQHLDNVKEPTASFLRLARRWVLAFCSVEMLGEYRSAAGDGWVRSGFWHRPDGAPQFSGDRPAQAGEGLAIMHRADERKRWNGGGHRAFWSFGVEHDDRVHPTQKPLPLMLKLVEQFTEPGDLVLDPFCGSGTTGVACLRLGRRFVGVERDKRYADLAVERLRAESSGLTLSAARSGQVALL